MRYEIAASLLAADFSQLGKEAQTVIDSGADTLHFDVMDNHFVPNLTMGPMFCAALRKYGITADISVHLMVEPVDRLIDDFAKAGASSIIFHPEASKNIEENLDQIHKHDCLSGIAINPDTDPSIIEKFLEKIDIVLVMSVYPGFGGQKFISSALDKIKHIKNDILSKTQRPIQLSVDGGIHLQNISEVARAGADSFVSGSGIFLHPPYKDVIGKMREKITLKD